MASNGKWLNEVNWDERGLVPVVVQEVGSDDVLMLAWMNREALERSMRDGESVYWSRSRRKLWHKGEESGHVQKVREIRLDCDKDAILIRVDQVGGIACHTGRHGCFFHKLEGERWQEVEPVLKDPSDIYKDADHD